MSNGGFLVSISLLCLHFHFQAAAVVGDALRYPLLHEHTYMAQYMEGSMASTYAYAFMIPRIFTISFHIHDLLFYLSVYLFKSYVSRFVSLASSSSLSGIQHDMNIFSFSCRHLI